MAAKPSIPRLSIQNEADRFLPAIPEAPSDVQTWFDPGGNLFSRCSSVDDAFRIDMATGLSFQFDSTGEEVVAVPRVPVNDASIRDTYHRGVLPMVLQALGMEALHASAILSSDGVYAFCANSGTGKSTLAYAFGRRGFKIWADDALAINVSPLHAEIESRPLPFNVRLWKDSREALASTAVKFPSHVQFDTANPDRRSAPLKAIFLLRRDTEMENRESVLLKRCPAREAFSKLLSHAYCFSLHDLRRKKTMIENYLFLSSQVPVYELIYRDGFEYLPQILDHLDLCFKEIHPHANAL